MASEPSSSPPPYMPKVIHDCPFVAQRSFALIASGVLPVEGDKTSARLLIHIDCDEEYSVRCPDRWGLDFHPRPSFFPCLFLARDNCSQRFIISFRGAHGAVIKGLEYASFTVGTRSVYYSLIGALSDAGLSIGAHLYRFWKTIGCAHVWSTPRALLRLRVFGWVMLGFSL